MDGYYQRVIESLNIQDIEMLRILVNEKATARFKTISNSALIEKSGLSKAIYHNTTTRLTAMCLIETNSATKEHSIFINRYGIKALGSLLD